MHDASKLSAHSRTLIFDLLKALELGSLERCFVRELDPCDVGMGRTSVQPLLAMIFFSRPTFWE